MAEKLPTKITLEKQEREAQARSVLKTPTTRKYLQTFLVATESQVNDIIVALYAEGILRQRKNGRTKEYWIDETAAH